jgi:hypothetical protein
VPPPLLPHSSPHLHTENHRLHEAAVAVAVAAAAAARVRRAISYKPSLGF